MIDYDALIAELRAERDAIDETIKAIESLRGRIPRLFKPAPAAPALPVSAIPPRAEHPLVPPRPAPPPGVEPVRDRQHARFTPRAPKPAAVRPETTVCEARGCVTRLEVGPRGPLPRFCSRHGDNRNRQEPPEDEAARKRRESEERIAATEALNRR